MHHRLLIIGLPTPHTPHTHSLTHTLTHSHILTHSSRHRLGMFGDVRVLYSIQSANAADLALAAEGASLFGYFSTPVRDLTLMPSAILRFLTDSTLEGCGTACLSDQACLSFAHDVVTSLCQLYLVTRSGANSVTQTGPVYYEKFQAMVRLWVYPMFSQAQYIAVRVKAWLK